MQDNNVYIVKNLRRLPVKVHSEIDGPVYEYLTRTSDDAPRGTPLGMSKTVAEDCARRLDMDPDEAVILAPDDIVVVLDDSARKLPRGSSEGTIQQVSEGVRLI